MTDNETFGVIYMASSGSNPSYNYVGQTTRSLDVRKREHIRSSGKGVGVFHKALRNSEKSDWTWQIVDHVTTRPDRWKDDQRALDNMEVHWIMASGSLNTMLTVGYHAYCDPVKRQKISGKIKQAWADGRYDMRCVWTDEERAEASVKAKQQWAVRRLDPEKMRKYKARLANSMKGNTNTRGYTHTDETRRKMSQLQIGSKRTDKTRRNMSVAQRSRFIATPVSASTRAKLSIAATGRVTSEATKRKISEGVKRAAAERRKRQEEST